MIHLQFEWSCRKTIFTATVSGLPALQKGQRRATTKNRGFCPLFRIFFRQPPAKW
jgi:hypothetical protein